jgi:hypothetical protein
MKRKLHPPGLLLIRPIIFFPFSGGSVVVRRPLPEWCGAILRFPMQVIDRCVFVLINRHLKGGCGEELFDKEKYDGSGRHKVAAQ